MTSLFINFETDEYLKTRSDEIFNEKYQPSLHNEVDFKLEISQEIKLNPSPLRISTHVITSSFNAKLDLDKLYQLLYHRLIPIWYPGEGILKMEHGDTILGASQRDCFTNRDISEHTFHNQSTIVLRREYKSNQWKESNVKLFANGSLQMTGVPSVEFAKETLEWLLEEIKSLPESSFTDATETPMLQEISVKLINTDYFINALIKRDALFQILVNRYSIFSINEKTIYQGVNAKYYFNKANTTRPGICSCKLRCRGQGTGDGDGECKRVTLCIFQDGKIIVTGARTMEQITEAYNFLNKVLQDNAKEVLRHLPNTIKA
jgi:TATA-box binding protein (TBP) (component of TFIID and TFIIIB)